MGYRLLRPHSGLSPSGLHLQQRTGTVHLHLQDRTKVFLTSTDFTFLIIKTHVSHFFFEPLLRPCTGWRTASCFK